MMIVKLKPGICKQDCQSLSHNWAYLVLEIEADNYRILDDDDDPVLFDNTLFDIIDNGEPSDWVSEYGEGGERYAQPGNLGKYVWEQYHDDIPAAVAAIKDYLGKVGPCRWPLTNQ